jgi:hypothetical protein
VPSVFFSYSHADEALRDQLEVQLAMLKRQGVIDTWHDRRITAGEDLNQAIDDRINADEIILLLVSPDFLASNYCYEIEMTRAMERHRAGEAVVIPVILRPSDWLHPPLKELRATPRDGLPVTKWPDRDEAFLDVVKDIRAAAERLAGRGDGAAPAAAAISARIETPAVVPSSVPRSSNLRLAKTFTERDKDAFKLEAFEFIARFFEASLDELATRNRGIEGAFRRIDANRFTAAIYREGKAVARGTVWMGGTGFGDGICYVQGETTSSNSMNELLSVGADDQSMFLQSMGMAMMRGQDREQKLSAEGAAELYWSILIQPLQRNR